MVRGRVKWFDTAKGFGFVVSDECEADILLHANVLRNFGQSTVADGAEIVVRIQQTQRGVQAVEVVSIAAVNVTPAAIIEDGTELSAEELATLPLLPARVKWFDKAKGFGFANVFERPQDVFVHIEVLRTSGFADLQPGEAICLRVIEGRRGQMAVQVLSWETAAKHGA